MTDLPPLPEGFRLEGATPPATTGGLPPLPDGFALDGSSPHKQSLSVGDYAADIGKGAASGLARGVSGIVGIPGALQSLTNAVADQTVGRAVNRLTRGTWDLPQVDEGSPLERTLYRAANASLDAPGDLPGPQIGAGSVLTGANVQRSIEGVAGPLYNAKTVPGQYAQTLAEFAPGAVFGSGSAAQRLAQVAVPAISSETAGQATKGTSLEPWARLGGALAGGVGTALAQRPAASGRVLSRSLEGVDPADIRKAEQLKTTADHMGVPLTWDEAIGQVTNGASRRLTNVRRVVQNKAEGAGIFDPLMAQRPGQVAAAGERELGSLVSGQPMDSATTGGRIMRAADSSLSDTQTAINAATRPDYLAAQRQSVTPTIARALSGDPLYAQALKEVRSNPALNRTIANLPDDSVAVVDLVQRRLRETAENARAPGQASASNLIAANLEDARTAPLAAAEQATGGPMGDYARARAAQANLRQNLLEPLEAGPLGTMRGTPDVAKQSVALFPNKPAFNSEIPTAQAMGRLVSKDPEAAANLVHNHLRTAFDEATQNLQSGPNPFGGAKFAAVIKGNGQQSKNLQAAVEQLPNGAQRWQGLNRFFDVLEGTGQAPTQGSMTSFNTEIQKELGKGGLAQGAGEIASTGGVAWLRKSRQLVEDWNAGRNSEQIARILTAPNSGKLLERLASLPPGSKQAQTLALRLSFMGRVALKPSGQEP